MERRTALATLWNWVSVGRCNGDFDESRWMISTLNPPFRASEKLMLQRDSKIRTRVDECDIFVKQCFSIQIFNYYLRIYNINSDTINVVRTKITTIQMNGY